MGTSQSLEEPVAARPPVLPPRSRPSPPPPAPPTGGGRLDGPAQPPREREHVRHHHHSHTHHHRSHHHSSHASHPSSHRQHSHHLHSHPPLPPRDDPAHLDFASLAFAPSLDPAVPRPRSSSSSGARRHRRTHPEAVSSSAPTNSLFLIRGLTSRVSCPLCTKDISPDQLEQHIIACMTSPQVLYNVDTLAADGGECSICLDDMETGDKIARLPCLCIYHVKCLQQWYTVSQTCPEHPESKQT